MAPIEIYLNADIDFKDLVNVDKYYDAMTAAMKRIGAQLSGDLSAEAPVDQGNLAGHFSYEYMNVFEVRVGTNVSYAKHVLLGTAPHPPPWPPWAPIAEWAARHGLPAAPVYFHVAKHGIKGDDYASRAEAKTRDVMPDIIETYLRKAGLITS